MAVSAMQPAQVPHGNLVRFQSPTPPLTRQTGALPGVRSGDLLPWGFKVRGTNLTPSIAQQQSATGGAAVPSTVWSETWATWDIAWIRTQLDHAVTLGCNTVRIQGTVYGIYSGRLTRSAYLAHWTELSQECQKRGLYMYPCGGDGGGNDRRADVPNATLITEVAAWAAHMHTLPDIIGLDLQQEIDGFAGSGTLGADLYTACKAVTNLPCGYSNAQQPDPVSNAAVGYHAAYSDFLDFHIYYAPDATKYDTFLAGDTRPMMIGEYGNPDSEGTTAIASRAAAVRTVVNRSAAGRRVAGAMQWAVRDYDTVNTNMYGAFDSSGVEKPTQAAGVRALPIT